MTMKEYMEVGERALDLTRAFNARERLMGHDAVSRNSLFLCASSRVLLVVRTKSTWWVKS
jgi:hypothetical protein